MIFWCWKISFVWLQAQFRLHNLIPVPHNFPTFLDLYQTRIDSRVQLLQIFGEREGKNCLKRRSSPKSPADRPVNSDDKFVSILASIVRSVQRSKKFVFAEVKLLRLSVGTVRYALGSVALTYKCNWITSASPYQSTSVCVPRHETFFGRPETKGISLN